MRNCAIKSLCAVTASTVIMTGTLTASGGELLPDTVPDWLAHFGGFAFFAGLLALMSKRGCAGSVRAVAIALFLAAATEAGQSLVGSRHPDWADFAANAAGVFFGLGGASAAKAVLLPPSSKEAAMEALVQPADLWRTRKEA